MRITKRNIRLVANALAILMMFIPAFPPMVQGGARSMEETDRRMTAGLELFPNIVSVDLDLAEKRLPDGALLLWIVHSGSSSGSGERAERIVGEMRRSVRSIQQIPVIILSVSALSDPLPEDRAPGGIFLLDLLPEESFIRIRNVAIRHHALLFSPHAEDIKRGATMGLKINSKIRTVVNTATLRESGIRLHPEFIRLSVSYE